MNDNETKTTVDNAKKLIREAPHEIYLRFAIAGYVRYLQTSKSKALGLLSGFDANDKVPVYMDDDDDVIIRAESAYA